MTLFTFLFCFKNRWIPHSPRAVLLSVIAAALVDLSIMAWWLVWKVVLW